MQQITKNVFVKGRDTDTDKHALPPDAYLEAHNVELIADGEFSALKNLAGTTSVKDITFGANVRVLGVYENLYKIGAISGKKCITIITLDQDPVFVDTLTGELTYEGFAIVDLNVYIEPPVGELVFEGFAPSTTVTVAPGVGAGTYAGFIPTIVTEVPLAPVDVELENNGVSGDITVTYLVIDGETIDTVSGSFPVDKGQAYSGEVSDTTGYYTVRVGIEGTTFNHHIRVRGTDLALSQQNVLGAGEYVFTGIDLTPPGTLTVEVREGSI
jgi:hypothetical protein